MKPSVFESIDLNRRLARFFEVRIGRAELHAAAPAIAEFVIDREAGLLECRAEIEDRGLGAQVDVVESRIDEIVATHFGFAHDRLGLALLRLRAKQADRRQQTFLSQSFMLRVQQVERRLGPRHSAAIGARC